jgi:hypothetical protein
MKELLISLPIIFLILINVVFAVDYIHVEDCNIDSFGGLIESKEEIYVGSILRYNIFLKNDNPKNWENLRFDVIIENPSKEIIENSTFFKNVKENSKFIINSSVSDSEWKLIYADVPGIYQLILKVTLPEVQLYEKRPLAFRHDYFLPFFFEVKSLEEKRLADVNKNLMEISENALIVSTVTLIIAIITLFSTPEGKKTFVKVVKWALMVLIIFLLITIILGFLLLS